MGEPTFARTFDTLRNTVTLIARAWLAAGARTFGVRCADEYLGAWGAEPGTMDLRAPIYAYGKIVGEVCVAGVADAGARARLGADAALIARLFEIETELDGMTGELVEAQDQLLALYDLDRSIRKHVSAPDTLTAVCREAARLVKVSGSFAWLAAPAGEWIVQAPPDGTPVERVRALIDLATARGERVLENDPAENYFVIPLLVHGATRAGLAWLNKRDGAFTSPDLKLARAIADQAGAQMENVLLYQETLAQAKLQNEMDLAVRIQLGLLPRTQPVVAALDVFGASRPASQVGGDFFGYLQRADQAFTSFVGDVAGKGISAALLMSMSYTVIRNAMRFMPAPTPASVLGRVSDDLYDELSDLGTFVTVFIAQYDLSTRALTYANAGHSPVIYCPAHGAAQLLIADGTAMGVLPGRWWEDQRLDFSPGDVLVVATDGFSEAQNAAGALLGYDRLLELIEATRHLSAQSIVQELYAAAGKFAAGFPQADDQTIIVIKGAG